MKYILLIYSDEAAWTDQERKDCYAESIQLTHQLQAQGQYLDASPLHSVATATSGRVREGKHLLTDGPFAETYEQLGGYFLINANDLDAAIAIAAQVPAARNGTVEVRPILELSGLPSQQLPQPYATLCYTNLALELGGMSNCRLRIMKVGK